MAIDGSKIVLKDINLVYPVTTGISQVLRHSLVGAVVGGVVEIDQEHKAVRIQALKDITLQLNTGTRTALLGHNGSGKTTLLKVMAGILHADSGCRLISGRIAPLLDTYVGLDDESTAHENIYLRGLLLGMSTDELDNMVESIIELANLGDFIHLPLRTLSSGMRNRLAFSISMSVQPDILLIDEGFGAGDWEFMETASKHFNKLLTDTQLLVLATHNEELMRRFCNQGVVLVKGSIKFVGPIEKAINFYKNSASG